MEKIQTYPRVIATEKNSHTTSYQIDFGGGMILYFDTWNDSDGLTGDWNKYIFHIDNARDMEEKAFQEANSDEAGAYNFAAALEACEAYEAA